MLQYDKFFHPLVIMKAQNDNDEKTSSTYDLSSMLVYLNSSIGAPNENGSAYPYMGPKLQGSDIGHIIGLNNDKYIIKAGVSLRLLTRAYIRCIDGKGEDERYIDYLLANYFRPITLGYTEEKTNQETLAKHYREEIKCAFKSYAALSQGIELFSMKGKEQYVSIQQAYKLFLYLAKHSIDLQEMIAQTIFTDTVSASISQQLNNLFQLSHDGDIAKHIIVIQPKNDLGLFQGSRYLEDAKPFDRVLLEPFENVATDSPEECEKNLRAVLANTPMQGLIWSILIRLILGENSDIGPDNMLLTEKGVINIDLTGFRYDLKPTEDSQANENWKKIVMTDDIRELLDKILNQKVFKDRFIVRSLKHKDFKETIYPIIAKVLKEKIYPFAMEEVSNFRDWLADLDSDRFKSSMCNVMRNLHEHFSDTSLSFPKENLEKIMDRCGIFIERIVSTARASKCLKRVKSSDNLNLTNLSLFKPSDVFSSRIALSIIESLCFANTHFSPRSLSLDERRQLILDRVYAEYLHKQGSRLKQEEVTSHVNAAQTSTRINLLKIMEGTLLFQDVRPKFWIGDYYSDNDKYTAGMLGYSAKVSDADDPKLQVDRVKIKLVVVGTQDGLSAATSIANPVLDTWSIVGESIQCEGGAKQVYMPLTSDEKKKYLRIVLPDNLDEQQSVIEIAQINDIEVISAEAHRGMLARVVSDIKLESDNIADLLETIESSSKLGNVQMLQSALEQCLDYQNIDEKSNARIRCLLSVIYALNGRTSDAEKLSNQLILQKLLTSDNEMDQKLSYLTQIHLAKSDIYPLNAIDKLKQLQVDINQTPCFTEIEKKSYQNLLTLECAIQYNRESAQYSTELTFKDFDTDGKQSDAKLQLAKQALSLLQQLDFNELPIQERIIALMEFGYAVRRSKEPLYFDEGIDALQSAQLLLQKAIDEKNIDYSQSVREEFALQLNSVKLNIGLLGIQCQRNVYLNGKEISPIEYLLNFKKNELDNLTAMQAKVLIKRWIGLDPSDLYLDGWWYHISVDKNLQGTELIALYRKYMPLDIKKYIRDLEDNSILELDLNYLGVIPPVGVTNENFFSFCEALSKNTSLKSLSLRKCALPENNNPECKDRMRFVFEALHKAQQNGQKLQYLFYGNSSFTKPEEYQACLNYLKENKSIKILQASLFDWTDPRWIQEFVSIIEHHSCLTTLLTDIIQYPKGGEMLAQACINSATIKHVYPYARALDSTIDGHEKHENQKILLSINKDLENKGNASKFAPSL